MAFALPKSGDFTVEHRRCPDCGDADHLYGKADVKWDRVAKAWIIAEWEEDGVECTTCDWAGSLEETECKDLPCDDDGGECGQCDGTGTTRSASNAADEPCPVCDATGVIEP